MQITVIIPNYNGAPFIKTLCQSLKQQTLPRGKYEIIIVDNGSTDESPALLNQYASDLPNLKTVVYTDIQSSYAARNYGASLAAGNILAFTDIDCRPQPDWLARISEFAKTTTGDFLLSGSVELVPRENEFNHYEWLDYCISLNQQKYSLTKTGATANLTVTKNVFLAVDGFKPIISGGDRDFCRRIMKTVQPLFEYRPDIKVLHPARATRSEIRKKTARRSEGHAILNFNNRSRARQCAYLIKQALGLLLLPNQWRIIHKTFKEKGWGTWSWRFLLIALREGFYARRHLVFSYARLIVSRP